MTEKKRSTHTTTRDRSLHRVELECIATALLFPEYLSQASCLQPSHFADTRLGRLWKAIQEMHASGMDMHSIALVAKHLQNDPDISPECASIEFLGELFAMQGVSPILSSYADIIIDAYHKRQIGAIARRIADATQNGVAASQIVREYKPLLDDAMLLPQHSSARVRRVPVNQVVDERIEWLWQRRIPLGAITLLVGRPGCGKSYIALDLASRISTGTPWPDEQSCDRGCVALMAAEDTPSTIKLRVRAMQGDSTRMHLLLAKRDYHEHRTIERPLSLTDSADIEETLSQIDDLRALIIDPINAYAPSKTDIYRDNEVRAMLQPIADMARRLNIAVLLISHHRKGGDGSSADAMVMGSVAYVGIARCVYHVHRDPTDRGRILLLPGKSNLGIEQTGLACRIIGDPAYPAWEHTPVTESADDILTQQRTRGRPIEQRDVAIDWLSERLAAGPVAVSDLLDEWESLQGSRRTLYRARDALSVVTTQQRGQYYWQLPPTSPADDDTPLDESPF